MLANLESVLSKSDEQALEQQAAERQTQYTPQVNHAISYVALVERVIQLLTGNSSHEQVLAELHHLFRTNPTRKRPERKVIRSPVKAVFDQCFRWFRKASPPALFRCASGAKACVDTIGWQLVEHLPRINSPCRFTETVP